MKPASLVLICVLVASLSGAGTAFLLMENQHDLDTMGDRSDDSEVAATRARLLELENTIEEMTRERRESPVLDIAALKELDRRYGKEVADLKSAVSKLNSKQMGIGGSELLASVGGEAAVEDVLSRVVEEAVAKKDAIRRKAERKRWTPFIKARMEKQLEKAIKKLDLRPDQVERFESTVRESMDTMMPALGIVMDPSAKKQEKIEAFAQIDGAMKKVDNDVQGYLDPSQYETFNQEQKKQTKQMEQMRSMFGGANGANTNGGSSNTN